MLLLWPPPLLHLLALVLVLLLLALPSPSSCRLNNRHRYFSDSDATQGLVYEELAARLGSMPPSCRNKCNKCHPWMPVQVPTFPSQGRAEPGLTKKFTTHSSTDAFEPSAVNTYSNYKPLGWKCECGTPFSNP